MNKKIVILGSGESGTGAALLSKAKGYDCFVSDAGTISDSYRKELTNASIAFEEGKHTEEKIFAADLIVKSPGISEKAEIMKKIRAKNIEVVSEIEFGFRHAKPGTKYVAITGSNGKTTTTLLTYHILSKLGYNAGLGGNIGTSLARQVINQEHDVFVLELSSFQLDDMYTFKADVAVLLNITPDHLDRYEYKFENYIASKFRITQNMTSADTFIMYAEDPVISGYLKDHEVKATAAPVSLVTLKANGAYASEIYIQWQKKDGSVFQTSTPKFPIQGKHNQVNIMAAVKAAVSIGAEVSACAEAILDFKNAPHRLEHVKTIDGVQYINDSKATNVDSVWYALDSMKTPVVLIAGGVDKGNDYSQIEQLVRAKVHTLIALGKDNTKVLEGMASMVPQVLEAHSMKEAVELASGAAGKGDTVLLSPACASFDLFKNYEDRGKQFRDLVTELSGVTK